MSKRRVVRSERWSDLFREDRLVHSALIATIVTGFFLAYIKDHYPFPLSYFLFDVGLGVTLLFWLTGTDRLRRLTLPRTPLTQPLLLFYAVCFVYMFFPDVPFLISLSAFRGWCVSSLAFFLGYDLIKSSRQVRAYLWIIVGLAMISGIYGVYQYAAGIESTIRQDEIAAQRHQFATYATEEGELEFRVFSTFVSAGAFGVMMAYAGFIAIALVVSSETKRREKIVLMMAIIPMMTSLMLTGARSALLMIIMGLIVLYWYKRQVRIYLTVATLIFIGVQLGIGLTEGRAVKRFATLTEPEVLLGRLSNPMNTGWQAIMDSPLGHGLGVTGHGVPFFLGQWYPDFRSIFSDGDFGRVMVEMGVVGLILFGYILWAAINGARRSLRALRSTPEQDVALAIFGSTLMPGIGTLVGSPFLSIPHGLLWWFFLGALFKLHALRVVRQRYAVIELPRHHRVVKLVRRRASVTPS